MMRLSALALLLAAQAAPAAAPPPPVPEPDSIAETLFLIGDAGRPASGGEPVLIALRQQVQAAAAHAIVVFLGDNLYPAGLPAPGAPDLAEMERRLDDQVDAVKDSGARVVFIPGNHDWAEGSAEGWDSVRREAKRVEERGGASVSFLPKGGCPGPEVLDLGERLRLVALDTQWWLQPHERPDHPAPTCPADSPAEVIAALEAALAGAGERDVVVVGHHPLQSGGPHGGQFGFKQHLFPLTEWKKSFYLPLPVIGSLYPAARANGVISQDIPSEAYGKMREAFAGALREKSPLAWASGHEHVLQVIESRHWGRVLVSGSGIYGHQTYVRDVEGSRFRAARPGYMRIDFLRDGRRRLGVIEVEKDGRSHEAFAKFVE
jgi:hypothetical protein